MKFNFEKYKILMKKSIDTIKNSGMKPFLKKAYNYIKIRKNINNDPSNPEKTFMDVLFINGCYLAHPSRYRVTHQKEQLFANGMLCNEIFFDKVNLNLIPNYRIFIFFRCSLTKDIEIFVKKAKEQNKVVLFDIDDLVIDRKYTDTIKYLKTMSIEEKRSYDEGVESVQKLLRICDGAITSTERLVEELKNYVPEVYLNRNTASDRMTELSNLALKEREKMLENEIDSIIDIKEKKKILEYRKKREKVIKIGYFSGSITHNDDVAMILPVIIKIMEEFENTELDIVGELDLPKELIHLKDRVKATAFLPWEKLPALIASVDINIAPIEESIFNEAKSENKWVEASLVKVPTIASNVGAFKKMIKNNKTGILCKNNEEWYNSLKELIQNKNKRKEIANNAYNFVIRNCVTLYTGLPLKNYLLSKMKPNIVFVIPSVQKSGGILVVLKHAYMLKKAGYDVLLINESGEQEPIKVDDDEILVASRLLTSFHGHIDKCVATFWETLNFCKVYPNIKERYYIVQNFETNFYEPGNYLRFLANSSYSCDEMPIKYITISKWCQNWLEKNYNRKTKFAPNGLNTEMFYSIKRKFGEKIIVLIEGNSEVYYKNVDESFKIVDQLDKDKYEIWFMSYQGEPKKWYKVDKFLHKIPYDKVPDIYRQAHILLKSSLLESFSYPPLEMMATGGFVVVAPNDGNAEYLRDGKNCLMYELGNIKDAKTKIEAICNDEKLREILYKGGIDTAKKRNWDNIENDILSLYNVINCQ